MKTAFTIAVLATLGCAAPAVAQIPVQQAVVREALWYWEIGGNGFFTGNVDRRIAESVSLRVGGMFIPLTDDVVPWSTVALVNKLVGREGHYLEIGAGVAAFGGLSANPAETESWIGPTAAIGYRREVRHTILRVTFAPVFVHTDGRRWLPMVGFSAGRTFR